MLPRLSSLDPILLSLGGERRHSSGIGIRNSQALGGDTRGRPPDKPVQGRAPVGCNGGTPNHNSDSLGEHSLPLRVDADAELREDG